MKSHPLFPTLCFVLSLAAITAKAEIIATYDTDGCNECIFEYNTSSNEYRWLHHDCGTSCWIADPWAACNGNCNLHWSNWKDPANGGYAPVIYGSGYVVVNVQPGRGGAIGNGTEVCHPFTADGGNTIIVPDGVAGIN